VSDEIIYRAINRVNTAALVESLALLRRWVSLVKDGEGVTELEHDTRAFLARIDGKEAP
jgi:hypothetical protein